LVFFGPVEYHPRLGIPKTRPAYILAGTPAYRICGHEPAALILPGIIRIAISRGNFFRKISHRTSTLEDCNIIISPLPSFEEKMAEVNDHAPGSPAYTGPAPLAQSQYRAIDRVMVIM